MQRLCSNAFSTATAIVPIRTNAITASLTRLQAPRLMGFSRLHNASELGAVCGFKTCANLLGKSKHHWHRRARNKLKERKMGQPTCMIIIGVGRIRTIVYATFGLLILVYYGWRVSAEPCVKKFLPMWPKYVQERNFSTFAYFGGSWVIAALTAAVAFRSPTVMRMMMSINYVVEIYGALFSTAAVGSKVRELPFHPDEVGLKQLVWVAHSALKGISFVAVCKLADLQLLRTAIIATGIALGVTIVALFSPSEKYLHAAGPLAVIFGGVWASSVASLFGLTAAATTPRWSPTIFIFGQFTVLAIFCGMLLSGIDMAVEHAQTLPPGRVYDPINASMSILFPDWKNIKVIYTKV